MKGGLKIAIAVVLLQLFSLLLQGFLDVYKYSALLTDLVRSRLEVVALDVKSNVEATVALGLALNELGNAEEMIRRMRSQDSLIKQIVIFETDSSGSRALYDTASAQTKVPARWVLLNMKAADAPWGMEESRYTQVVGAPIRDNTGRTVGGIAIRFDSSQLRERYENMVGAVVNQMIPILSVAVLVCLLFSLVVMYRLSRVVKLIDQSFADDGEIIAAVPHEAHGLYRIPEVITSLNAAAVELKAPVDDPAPAA